MSLIADLKILENALKASETFLQTIPSSEAQNILKIVSEALTVLSVFNL